MDNKKFIDFSFAQETYKQFRPDYPDSLFKEIMKRMKGDRRKLAIDVGAGNGQASIPLTQYFENVIAFDPSPGQLAQTRDLEHPNLEFREGTAEHIDVKDGEVDCLVAAQCAHWFELEKFYAEAKRVLRTDGLLSVWSYNIPRLEKEEANKLIDKLYFETLNHYWDHGRTLIDRKYRDITPNFGAVERDDSMAIEKDLSFDALFGYLGTWSGLNNYKKKHPDSPDPLFLMKEEMAKFYTEEEKKKLKVTWPIYMIYCRNENKK